MIGGTGAIVEHVELEPGRDARPLRDLVHIAHPHGRQRKRNANRLRRIGSLDFTAARVHSGHTHRPQHNRQ